MPETNSPSKTFMGFRFVLFGFDPINERKVLSKLVNGGGVDAGQYDKNCTHVIVDRIVYDDPACVAARNDGKTLVTGLWVDHSFDIGMPVDATSIMYRPLRDLNGIPGAKNLIICLTGYQRQDRDDIMTMVGLMGAQFSKPLVANRVTHLICYKFEGEKYELAKKMKKIKLVNHRWLEDCLRDWELLPEDNYSKSGYELEIMEAEAKDSQEHADGTAMKQSSCENANKSPWNSKSGTPQACELPTVTGEVPKVPHNLSEPEALPTIVNAKDMLVPPSIVNGADHALGSDVPGCQGTTALRDATSSQLPDLQERTPNSTKVCKDLELTPGSAEKSPYSDAKFGAIGYSRKTQRRLPLAIFSGESGNVRGSSKVQLGESINISSAKIEFAKDPIGSECTESPQSSELVYGDASSSKKRKADVSCSSSKSQKTSHAAQACVTRSPVGCKTQALEPTSLVDGLSKSNDHSSHGNYGHPLDGADSLNAEQKPEARDFGVENSKHKAVEAGELENQQRVEGLPSSCNRKSEAENSLTVTNLDVLHGGNGILTSKPVRMKTIAKKTLGSRPKLKNTANQKGSIYLNKTAGKNHPEIGLTSGKDTADSNVNEPDTSPENLNVARGGKGRTVVPNSGVNIENKSNFMDDEMEAPEEKDKHETALNEEKAEVTDLSHNAADKMDMKSEGSWHVTNNSTAGMHDSAVEDKTSAEPQKQDESTSKQHGIKNKMNKVKKQPSDKTKMNTIADAVDKAKSKQVVDREQTHNGKNVEDNAMENKKDDPCPVGQSEGRTKSGKKSKISVEAEKENEPVVDGDQNISRVKGHVGETAVKTDKTLGKFNQNARKTNPLNQVKTEPLLFILSGHKLQRKEFQQVIRHLKGKFCRDSHQWSYQATHFIAPDPIRRTEKFFAAAASGRWILKIDYLSACSTAGRLLAEEPYEWHKNGLSEDGAINLEAPRKWRLLRERTGHGAFYGMCIVIYGECIAPTLDTLKRVVKAGDGTILATSPPYTRFLTSGVDYAIISPGMPHVDMWIQEFLKHEIPCVLADYLVEFVCKPGYSLERHVLYNTHSWADKSFANLSRRAEEIVEGSVPSNTCSGDDIACQVCGSHDRGEVMLICGNEGGSVGCGTAMHIDCCDPPLEDVPEGDWFCPKCSGSRNSTNPPKKRKKRTLH